VSGLLGSRLGHLSMLAVAQYAERGSTAKFCTSGTHIGVMPKSGHDTKVCAFLETKVCVV